LGILRQSAATLFSRGLIMLINIPISMIIARTLGAEGQGIYISAITFPGLFAGIGLLGFDAAHLFFLARDRRCLANVAANSLLVFAVLLLLLPPIYAALLRPMLGEEYAALRPYLLLSTSIVPLMVSRHLFLALFLGLGKVEAYNFWLVATQVALLALVAAGLYVAKAATGFAVAAYAASLFLFAVPSLVWVRREMRRSGETRLRLDLDLLRRSFVYGLKGHPGTILTQFTFRFDMVLIFRWLGAAAQGYYSIAVLLAEKLTHLTTSVQFVLFPKISAARREDADRVTPIVCRQTLFWMALGGLALFALGRWFLLLFYTEDYLPALRSFRILLPGIVVLTVANLLWSDLSGRDRRGLCTIAMSISFVVNLALNFLWIPRFGIEGAAASSVVAYAVQSGVMSVFFWRLTGIPPWDLVIPRPGDFVLYRDAGVKLKAKLSRRATETP